MKIGDKVVRDVSSGFWRLKCANKELDPLGVYTVSHVSSDVLSLGLKEFGTTGFEAKGFRVVSFGEIKMEDFL